MSDYILLILGIIFMILGIIGCLVPLLPGPPVSFLGLFFLHLSRFGQFSSATLIIFASAAILVTVFDLLVPLWWKRKFGGSKYGTRGATIGLITGFFLGPFGLIAGAIIGAVIGEMIFNDDLKYAFKAGLGSLLSFLSGIGLKLDFQ
jgi:uncharacterized protein